MRSWLPAVILGLGVFTIFAFVRDFIWRFPMPQRHVQINPRALTHAPVAGAFVYGVSLGAGVLTLIPFASLFPFMLIVATQGSSWDAVELGAAYGLGRTTFPFLVAWLAPAPSQTDRAVDRLVRRRFAAALASFIAAVSLAALTFPT